MDDNGMAKGMVIGLVVGAAFGLAAGMLYAPKPGTETRSMLKEKAVEVSEKVGGIIDKVKELKPNRS